jgi:lipoprotein-releasing system permease protein
VKGLYWYIARHYLGAGGTRGLLSLITWIALGGVTVGVSALIVVVAAMSGMQVELQTRILESTPHMYVMERSESLRLNDWESVLEEVIRVDGVASAAPFVLTEVSLIRVDPTVRIARAATLYGVDTGAEGGAGTEMERAIAAGVLDLAAPASGLAPILLGSDLAEQLSVERGDTLVVASFENLTYALGSPEATLRPFEVTGTFTTGMYEYDRKNAYTTLSAAQEILALAPETAGGIGARATDPAIAQEVAEPLGERLGFPYFVQSWQAQNRAFFDNLRLTKLAMQLMLFLIAMGMTRAGIVRVFVLQGAWIGVAGTLLGTAAGVGLAWLIEAFELIRLPPEVYLIDHLPISLRWADVAVIVAGSITISFVATIYPAARASRLEPVEAIRND